MSHNIIKYNNISIHDRYKVVEQLIDGIKRNTKIICLYGDLGSGKTALASELINHLSNLAIDVTSPTFNIVHTYNTPYGEVWHMDLYRINSIEEVYNLGFDEVLDSKIIIIEWPQIIEHLLPNDVIKVYIDFCNKSNLRNYNLKTA